MKHYVKRDKHNSLIKSKLEFGSGDELTAVKMALNHYEEYLRRNNFDTDDDPKIRQIHEDVSRAIQAVEYENEMPWR